MSGIRDNYAPISSEEAAEELWTCWRAMGTICLGMLLRAALQATSCSALATAWPSPYQVGMILSTTIPWPQVRVHGGWVRAR